ncbi:MAG: Lrp/AsnC family transcriptional regulator [Solirubrobacteraceae bacterium]
MIESYTAVIRDSGARIEAFVELELTSGADASAFLDRAMGVPEVREGTLIAGGPDAILRLSTDSTDELAAVVRRLRQLDEVRTTKTLIALTTSRRQPGSREIAARDFY